MPFPLLFRKRYLLSEKLPRKIPIQDTHRLAGSISTCILSDKSALKLLTRQTGVQDPRKDPRQVLTRSSLLADLTAKGLLNLVPEPIRALYVTLDQDFSPLQLCKKLAPLLDQLDSMDQPLSSASPVQQASLAQYKHSLQQVPLLHSLQSLQSPFLLSSSCKPAASHILQ